MPNYDDLFTGQPIQQEEQPFDKTVWAARKQAEREGAVSYTHLDVYKRQDNIRPLAGEVFQGSDKDGIYGITSKHLEQIELGDPFGISAVILDFSDLQVFHAPRLERINDHNINT